MRTESSKTLLHLKVFNGLIHSANDFIMRSVFERVALKDHG